MEQPVEAHGERDSPDIPAGADHAPGDLLLEHWPRLAATAWEGFLLGGPGSVAITFDAHDPDFVYRPGSPCECHPIGRDSYDPRTQIIFVDPCTGIPALLSGWPDPPDAYAQATAEGLRRALQ